MDLTIRLHREGPRRRNDRWPGTYDVLASNYHGLLLKLDCPRQALWPVPVEISDAGKTAIHGPSAVRTG